jgi:hypothetical protein
VIKPAQMPARGERLRVVSVPKAVAAFLVAGLFVLTAVGIVLAVALRQTATTEAILQTRSLTSLEASSVVGPVLIDQALVPVSGFPFAQGLFVDPNNSALFVTEDATAGARSGRGHAWVVPFIP